MIDVIDMLSTPTGITKETIPTTSFMLMKSLK